VHLKLVIKSAADDGESLTTIGFGNDRAAFSSTAVHYLSLCALRIATRVRFCQQ